jgi:hypothetical protein
MQRTVLRVMGREVMVAETNDRPDLGTWERIFSGQAEWLARESRRPAAQAGAGQDHRGVEVLLMSMKHACQQTPVAMTDIDTSPTIDRTCSSLVRLRSSSPVPDIWP